MIQPNKIPEAFASSGDKSVIPDIATEQGQASWSEGFPQITQVPVSAGGVAPTREDFNGIFNALSAHVAFVQSGELYAWDDQTDYAVRARVKGSDGNIYESYAVSGPSTEIGAVSPVSEGQDVWAVASAGRDGQGNIISTTYATKAEDAEKLPLSGGTMTGALKNYTSYNPFNAVVKNNTVTSGAYCDLFRVYSEGESAILSRPRFYYDGNVLGCDWTFGAGTGQPTLKMRSNGVFLWNEKTIECAVEKGNYYLKLADGTQFCFGTATLNNTAGVNVSYPRAFKTAPIVVAIPVGSTTFNLHVAVGSRTTTAFNATGYNNAGTAVTWITCSYIAIGEGAD